jgi:HK97 family phage major capsid protein
MAVLDSGLQRAFKPEEYAKLFDEVLAAKSLLFKTSTVLGGSSDSIRIPSLTADPSVAFVPENTQITPTDPTTTEIVITPFAVKAITQLSNEALGDASNPAIAGMIANALARSVAKKLDAAWIAASTTNGYPGLLSYTGTYQLVDTDTYPLTNLDPFHVAKDVAYTHNAVLTHFVIAQDVALTLATLKIAEPLPTVGTTSYNLGLLGADGVNPGSLEPSVVLAGLPAYVSHDAPSGTAFGIDATQQFTYQRTGTNLAVSADSAFDYDAIRIRVTARVGFKSGNPAGLVHIAASG